MAPSDASFYMEHKGSASARKYRAFSTSTTRRTHAKCKLTLGLSACFRHPRAVGVAGIHLSGECEARVRDTSPTERVLCAPSASTPLQCEHVWPIRTGAIGGIRDDTAGTNDALSRGDVARTHGERAHVVRLSSFCA